jgi:hypothetical protein
MPDRGELGKASGQPWPLRSVTTAIEWSATEDRGNDRGATPNAGRRNGATVRVSVSWLFAITNRWLRRLRRRGALDTVQDARRWEPLPAADLDSDTDLSDNSHHTLPSPNRRPDFALGE